MFSKQISKLKMCLEWKKHRNWVQFFSRDRLFFLFVVKKSEDFRSIIYQICKLSQKVQRVFTPNKATSQAWQLEKDWQKRRDDTKREERGGVKITHDSSQYTIFLCIVLYTYTFEPVCFECNISHLDLVLYV